MAWKNRVDITSAALQHDVGCLKSNNTMDIVEFKPKTHVMTLVANNEAMLAMVEVIS